jgi:hypothetical protein
MFPPKTEIVGITRLSAHLDVVALGVRDEREVLLDRRGEFYESSSSEGWSKVAGLPRITLATITPSVVGSPT